MSLWLLTRILAAIAAAIGAFVYVMDDVAPGNLPKDLYEYSKKQTEETVKNFDESSP
jgi:hypothetical protein